MNKQEKIKKYTLKMELLAKYLTFRNRLGNRPEEGSLLLKKEQVKVLNLKTGT